jgi:hypothetical protein
MNINLLNGRLQIGLELLLPLTYYPNETFGGINGLTTGYRFNMFFFTRKKTVVVDCFTAHLNAYTFAPIVKTTKTMPNWFKKLPNPGFGNPTIYPKSNNNMRRCYGFVELYKRGFVIEHWSDLHVEVNRHGTQVSGSDIKDPISHPKILYAGAFDNWHHMKLDSPWAIREKSGIHFAWIGADWALDHYQLKVLPGVLEFKINHSANINMMLPIKEDPYSLYIEVGQPLVQVIPMRDDLNFDYRVHLVTEGEMNTVRSVLPSFKGFNTLKRLVDRNEERAASDKKCPFRF